MGCQSVVSEKGLFSTSVEKFYNKNVELIFLKFTRDKAL